MQVLTIPVNSTEADVETQFIVPVLTRSEFLDIPLEQIKSKQFLAAQDIGKGNKQKKGYIPDFCVYKLSIPVLVIEAKSPSNDVTTAWEEATLYAHALNRAFPSGINPAKRIFATNGVDFLAGDWDAAPALSGKVKHLTVGSSLLDDLKGLIGTSELDRLAELSSVDLRLRGFKRPFNQGNGPALLNSKVDPNTFATDLAPTLRRYFSSRDQNKDPEIYTHAYVSSDEVTSYDRLLESFLKDRVARSRAQQEVQTSRRKAEGVSRRIATFAAERPQSGDLQLVTGGVGAGKSLFARRYKEHLQTDELRERTHWAFIDFNYAPDSLAEASEWACRTFVESLLEEGAPVDLRSAEDQERVFAEDLKDRASYYDRMSKLSPERGELERARDIEEWRIDPLKLTAGMARYLQGDRGDVIVAVFDNVDRRDVENQLSAFQLALWFMNMTRSLVVLQMRDVTFEAFKDTKPLDTYKTGQIFHIVPPRFIDVVKRRLELSLEELARKAPETIKISTKAGPSVSYPKGRAGDFLKQLYLELFQRPTNVSRVLEALAGRNVRKALDMFMAIITSGHMSEQLITSVATGQTARRFPEHLILRILMRQDYRYFHNSSGFVANIFTCESGWARPNNFLVIEILFMLIGARKVRGDNGQMGFLSLARVKEELEACGFVRTDIHAAAEFALKAELIEADSAAATALGDVDSIKATAAGWVHMRLLSSRIEYVYSVIPVTPINEDQLSVRAFELMQLENRVGDLSINQKLQITSAFYAYLNGQYQWLRRDPGYARRKFTGAAYILDKIAEGLEFNRRVQTGPRQFDLLDG